MKAQWQKEAKQRGVKSQGPERSSRRGNQQPDQRPTAESGDDDSGFVVCFALGQGKWMTHEVDRYWKKNIFNEKLQHPDQCESMLKRAAMKPQLARVDKSLNHISSQSNPSRTSRSH